MNIFQKIAFISKVKKAVKEAKKMIDKNKGLAADVKNRLHYLICDFEELIGLLPQFKPLYFEASDFIKETFKK